VRRRFIEGELSRRGIPHDVKEYPNVGHSFANQFHLGPLNLLAKVTDLGYDRETSQDAWRRVLAFFANHLRGPAPESG